MKIAISLLSFRPGKIGGAETYIRQLLAALVGLAGDDSITLVASREVAGEFAQMGYDTAIVDAGDWHVKSARCLEAFTPYRAKFAEKAFGSVSPDVAFFPQQSIFPRAVGCPAVLTVHDVQHRVFPSNYSRLERSFRRSIYVYSLARADRIIAISASTGRMLVDLCGVPSNKVSVIQHGMCEIEPDAVGPSRRVAGKYLYYPAASFRHKGHDVLIRTFAELKRRGGFDCKLVLTGRKTAYWRKCRRLIRSLSLDDDVVHLGFVEWPEVLELYKAAEAVVFPSQFEGFGLPVLEATCFGRKVICSRLDVFDEIGVPRQNQIDFSDPDALLSAMKLGPLVLEKPPRSWRDAAEATLNVLRQAAGGAR